MKNTRKYQSKFLLITVLSFCFNLCLGFNAFGQTITFNSASTIPAGTSSPRLYEVYEIRFNIANYDSMNRFNDCRVEVYAEITTPSVTIEKMPAFYKSDTSPNWAVRYAPKQGGTHSYKLVIKQKATDCTTVTSTFTSSTFTFTAQSSSLNSGFMQVDSSSIPASKRFKTSNGNAFVINGINTPWSECKSTLGGVSNCINGGSDWDINPAYETVFSAMQTNKMNFSRMFLNLRWDVFAQEFASSNNGFQRGINITYNGLNNYNLPNSDRLDQLVQNAQSKGIYMAFVLRDHLEFFVNNGWYANVYNSSNNGGVVPCTTPTCFITNASAKHFFKSYIRYIYARYGAFTSVGIIEYWNEWDNGGGSGTEGFSPLSNAELTSWHSEMQTYLSQIDIYSKPTTTSFSWRDHYYSGTGNNIWNSLTTLTARNTHIYNNCGFDVNTKTYNFSSCEFPSSETVNKWTTQINHLKTAGGSNKPSYIAEYGPIGETLSPISGTPDWYRIRNFYQDGTWIPFFFAEAAGTNMMWSLDRLDYLQFPNVLNTNYWGFVPHSPASDSYKAFGSFLENEQSQLPTMTFGSCTASTGLGCSGYKKSNRALALVRDTTSNGSFEVYPNSNSSGTITLTGMTANASFTVEFWDTLTGTKTTSSVTANSTGSLTITLPSFSRNIAVKAIQGTTPPPTCNGATKLSLTSSSLSVNLTPAMPLANLVDSQTGIPNSPPITTSSQGSQFIPSWSTSSTNPTEVTISLSGTKCLKSFWYYDAEDQGTVQLSYKTPSGTWITHSNFDVNQYLVWRSVAFANISATDLRLRFTNSPRIGEIAVYFGN
ncbi:MAG: DUF5060 domain-containing protein [Pyrinomonadaceae bacterium]|jgi:hypothetical protein|nr:DUF5060 domain-containing protein [Pyrinomonadaceae bacterium]